MEAPLPVQPVPMPTVGAPVEASAPSPPHALASPHDSTPFAAQPQQQQQQQSDEKAAADKQLLQQQQQMANDALMEDSSAFECNICLELSKEPVVTLCGHLYCWPCLYRWMQVQSYCRACPVCKAGVEVDKVIPIYGRGSEATARHAEAVKVQPVPPRPVGQRPVAVQVQSGTPAAAQQGVLPALFGFQLGPGQGYVEALTPEQQHQAFLSRLLLMLGSFVIMCLLLF